MKQSIPVKERIVAVDASKSILEELSGILREEYDVYTFLDGSHIVSHLKEILPSLILLDIAMPKKDGFEMLAEIKADRMLYEIPVVFLADPDDLEREEKGFELGAADYIFKPLRHAIVRARVKNQIVSHVGKRNNVLDEACVETCFKALARQADKVIIKWDYSMQKISSMSNFEAMFGRKPVTRHTDREALDAKAVHPDDSETFSGVFRAITQGRDVTDARFRVADAQGVYNWCKLSVIVINDKKGKPYRAVGILENIEEDLKRESAIDEQRRMQELISLIPGGIIIARADDDFTIEFANDGYYELVGYTREEHTQRFKNIGMRTLHPDDAQQALSSARAQWMQTGFFCVKAKLAHKRHDYIWAQFSGRLCTSEDGIDRINTVIVDISQHVELMEQLQKEQEFSNLIASFTDDAFFDGDILNSEVRFSKNFADRFGIDEVVQNYPQSLIEKGIITEKNTHLYKRDDMSSGENVMREEIHLKLPNGEDAWYLCHYNVILDERDTPIRSVGKMTDITKQRLKIKELSDRAEIDQLTGLYNKATTEYLIKKTLKARRASDNQSALMIIDVDDFKSVNDKLGHYYGDLALARLAHSLKSMFRSDDIVGRIGGDEFFVFLKNFSDSRLVKEKAEKICRLFRKTYTENGISVNISASVGISLCPENSVDFDTLYQNADRALYQSKAAGKNTFLFFNAERMEGRNDYSSARTKIDTDVSVEKEA